MRVPVGSDTYFGCKNTRRRGSTINHDMVATMVLYVLYVMCALQATLPQHVTWHVTRQPHGG
jgi:hypothetical protein